MWTALSSYNGRTFDIKPIDRRPPNIQYYCVDAQDISKGLHYYMELQETPEARAARIKRAEEEARVRKAMAKAKAEEEARL